MPEHQQHIKDRMIRTAARIWGLPESETENNFDPLVAMLLGACADELEKISGEIESSRARVLERIVQLLSPEALTGPLAAHAVAHAQPTDAVAVIGPETQFFVSRRQAPQQEGGHAQWKDVYFTPAGRFKLNQAQIAWSATGNKLYRHQPGNFKELTAMALPGQTLPSGTIWLALQTGLPGLQGLQFYFDMPRQEYRDLFFNQLTQAQWTCQEAALQMKNGYNDNDPGLAEEIEAMLQRDITQMSSMNRQVTQYYRRHFITCHNGPALAAKPPAGMPPELASLFGAKDREQLAKTPLHWIAIRFPQPVHAGILEQVTISLNCFPVVNARLHEINTRLREYINVIPLYSEDIFLDLWQVCNADGRRLNIRQHSDGSEENSVLLRFGGVGRFDARDAAHLVENTIRTVRDESAAFAGLGLDIIGSEMTSLRQSLNKIEQRQDFSDPGKSPTPYLMVSNNQPGNSDLYIQYWSTCGAAGNNIRAGAEMQIYRAHHISGENCMLISTSTGGRNHLSDADKVLAYKTALLSKEKLVTAADIAAYCKMRLAIPGANICISKSNALLPGAKQGFCKTIDIHIGLSHRDMEALLEKGTAEYWQNDLRIAAEERSSLMMPMRVFIKEEELN